MWDIILSVAASMATQKFVSGVAKTCGLPEPAANALGQLASRLVSAEMNTHDEAPVHHAQPSASLLHETGPFAEFRRHRAG